MNLIGIVGLAGSGKSSLAAALARRGWTRVAFADELKRIAREQFGWDGVKDERGRRLLQVLGTEAGRAYRPDIWVERLFASRIATGEPDESGRSVDYMLAQRGARVVIDDCRFPNEVEAIRARGGRIVLVTRTAALPHALHSAHESEQLAWAWTINALGGSALPPGVEHVANDGSLEELEAVAGRIDAALKEPRP